MTLFHIWAALPWPSTLGCLPDHAVVAADAHASLSMTGQCVVSSKDVSAETLVWFITGVDFGVTLKIMSADKALLAMITFELTVTEMSLDV
jgi:hypothetical protein